MRPDWLSKSGFHLIHLDPFQTTPDLHPNVPTGFVFDSIQPRPNLLITIKPWVPRQTLTLFQSNQDPVSRLWFTLSAPTDSDLYLRSNLLITIQSWVLWLTLTLHRSMPELITWSQFIYEYSDWISPRLDYNLSIEVKLLPIVASPLNGNLQK